MRTSTQNWFATTVTSQVGPESLVADVATTGNLTAPAYIVFNPRSPSQREVWLADVTFTATRFETSAIANRYLAGSAESSGLTHNEGTEVWSVPLSQNLDDMWDELDAKASDPHGNEAHDPDFAEATHDHDAAYVNLAGDTMTGALDMDGNRVISPRQEHFTFNNASGTMNVWFDGNLWTYNLSGDVTFASLGLAAGKYATLRLLPGASTRTLAFPAGWVFVGPKPVDIAADKTGILTVEAFGATDADVVAAWAVQE